MKELIKRIKEVKREEWLRMGGCFLIGILVMLLFYPSRITKLKNGEEIAIETDKTNISADDFYNNLKKNYAKYALLEIVDRTILDNIYEFTSDMQSDIDDKAEEYISYYEENYSMSEEDFLSNNGFDSLNDFKEYLKLDYLRQEYYSDYLESKVSNEDIEEYYNSNVYAPFNVEHILVSTSSMSDSDASDKINEILSDLNNGKSWDEVKEDYESDITVENFDVEFDSNYEDTFKSSAENLSDGKYSGIVETSYGYHIIYRISTSEKESLDSVKSRILTILKSEYEDNNENAYEISLIEMREYYGLDIKDTELKKVYNTYIKDYK